MRAETLERNQRAYERDRGGTIPVEVVAINLDGEPTVDVRPLVKTKVREIGGNLVEYDPLEIKSVPYSYPSSGSFAIFVPPEVGMQGFLLSTDGETTDVGDGSRVSERVRDRSTGVFMPSGNLSGANFSGNEGWAEIRSGNARIAISENGIHLQVGENSFAIDQSGHDITLGGVSLLAALQEMSDHIAFLEDFVHPIVGGHGGKKDRLVDNLVAATVPTRTESGVR